MLCIPEDPNTGWMGQESKILSCMGGRWTHRENGYILPKSKADVATLLIAHGWTASSFVKIFRSPSGQEMDYTAAKKAVKELK